MVATGLTNRQIASRLSLSFRMVECHLWGADRETRKGMQSTERTSTLSVPLTACASGATRR